MPPVEKLPWYASYLKEAMKGWGLASIIILTCLILTSVFFYQHGSMWIETKIEVERSNAQTAKSVAAAVTKLADVADKTIIFQDQVNRQHIQQDITIAAILDKLELARNEGNLTKQLIENAYNLMEGTPARSEKTLQATEESLRVLKEMRDILQKDKPDSQDNLYDPTASSAMQ